MFYDKLVENRKNFLEQLYNLCKYHLIENLEFEEKIRTISIDASWGMGKTFFAESFNEFVNEKNKEGNKKIEIMQFNAWSSDYFNDPMKSLIGELNAHNLINSDTENKVKKLFSNGGKITIKLVINFLIKSLKLSKEDISMLKELVSGMNESELEDYKKYKKMVEEFKSCYDRDEKLKIIVIDELDRCRPNYAIELLETIKHIFDIKNIVFIFLVNKEQLKNIVSTMYVGNDGSEEYFEKFFDIQFKMPEIDYEEYMISEYSSYLDINIYNVKSGHKSGEISKFSEFLFLEIFKINDEKFSKNKTSIRTMKKIFRKYKILLKSLEENERESYPLILSLCIYILIRELKWESKDIKTNNLMAEVILNTFFKEKSSSDEGNKYISNHHIEKSNYNWTVHEYLYLNFKHEIGIEITDDFRGTRTIYSINKTNNDIKNGIGWDIGNKKVVFDMSCDYGYSVLSLPLDSSFIEKCFVAKENAIEKWCSKKYDFISNL